MIPERWRRIEEAFQEACDAPAEERSALLDRACGDDAALRAEVESLLEASPGATMQIEGIIGREASLVAESSASPLPERRLGPYRLIRELGKGGMGAVYLAVRDDDQYRNHVAVKLLHWGLETVHAVARFRDERQILATLEHPGIVRLLDGGSTEDRLPYLVMEHVEGAPITHYADTHDLGVTARVALFRTVCAAVSHAHQKLVVHRDLKPSNILVTEGGAPKLLDFGIAKLLDTASDVGREAQTRTGMRLFTPEYASPEQVRGEPASTSTDVYSLGAVLYELCTGAPAHRIEGDGEGIEALRAVLEVDPPRPSAVAPAARRRALAGDLDNILLKALHKESARRYGSVEQLSEDLRRHLEGLPVLARPTTFGYRAGKFIRRSRGILAAVGMVVLALGTATVVSVRQAQRADVQSRRADNEARMAQKRFDDVRRLVNSMLFEVDGKIQSLEGATEARELIVSRALEYLDGLAGEAGDDPALSRELATAYMKIGDIQGSTLGPNLGRPQDGLASYKKAKQIVDRLVTSGHSDTATRWALVRALLGIGALHRTCGEFESVRTSVPAAMQIVETLPEDAAFDHRLVALGYMELAMLAQYDSDVAGLERYGKACLEAATKWSRVAPSPEARYWVGIAHEIFSGWLSQAADPEAAIRELDEAHTIFAALVTEHPQNAAYRRELLTSLFHITLHQSGSWYWAPSTGDLGAAEATLREVLLVSERQAERDVKDSRAALQLAETLDHLAATISERDPAASMPLFQRARGIVAAVPASVRESVHSMQVESSGSCAMAVSLAKVGRRTEALVVLEQGLAAAVRVAETGKTSLTWRLSPWICRYQAARAHQALGDTAASARVLEEISAGLREMIASQPSVIHPYVGLINTLELLASIRTERRCEILGQGATLWSSWPGAPTSYTRRRKAALEVALAACPAGR